MSAPATARGRFARIVVPTDFSAAASEALGRGLALAVQHDAALEVFHVQTPGEDPERLERDRAEVRAEVERVLARSVRRPVVVEHVVGSASPPGPAILARVAEVDADLVVMATHGGGVLSPSVAECVVRDAPCSVLTCRRGGRGRWPLEPGPIVVAVDLSDDSRRALEVARALATEGSSLVLVHVVDTSPHPLGTSPRTPAFAVDATAAARLQRRVRAWAGAPVDAVVIEEGEPRPTLLDVCRRLEAVLVVVGTHAEHSMEESFVGTTAVRLTRSAAAPVLTVRG